MPRQNKKAAEFHLHWRITLQGDTWDHTLIGFWTWTSCSNIRLYCCNDGDKDGRILDNEDDHDADDDNDDDGANVTGNDNYNDNENANDNDNDSFTDRG